MTEVYIAQEQSGSYDDFSSKNIAVFVDKQKAENFCLFKNEAIRLVYQTQEQIPVNEATILFEAREKYNIEQMKILLEKSSFSEEMKEEIMRLFNLGCWSYENNNSYCICALSITE